MIRSSKHPIINCNKNKIDNLNDFLLEYTRVSKLLVDYMWENGCFGGNKEFNIKENKLDMPPMLHSGIIKEAGIESNLTGRALKCCITQCCGMIRSEVEKQRKRLYIYKKKKSEGVPKRKLKKLIKKIKENIPVSHIAGI